MFSNGEKEVRYIREILFGKRRTIRYWQITTDSLELPENSTWFVMTNLPGDIQTLKNGFLQLIDLMNEFNAYLPDG